jgi:ligand-binding sensor domain-containing protein
LQAANWQLQRETWTVKEGAPEHIFVLAPASDGFLWLGGVAGLYRFDGRQFELFQSTFGDELLSTNIRTVYAPPSGELWVGYVFWGSLFSRQGENQKLWRRVRCQHRFDP